MQLPGGRMDATDVLPHEESSFKATGAPPLSLYTCTKPPRQCFFLALREFFEETGIRLSPENLIAVGSYCVANVA